MAEQLVEQFGYVGLAIASFLAATIFPFSSEVVVVLMASWGFNKQLIFLYALTGNFLGALSNYFVGKLGSRFFLSKYISGDNVRLQQAQRIFERWGAPILFFSWLPIIGEPLIIVSGILNRRVSIVALWLLLGRGARYLFILWLADIFVRQ